MSIILRNFIFDVDRTLVDSYNIELATLKEALFRVLGISYSDEVMNRLTKMTTRDFFESIGIEQNSDIMNEINHEWELVISKRNIVFFDGIVDVLLELKRREKFLGIVTSRTKEELDELDELLKFLDLFDMVVTSDMVTCPKPNSESLDLIINKFKLNRNETIYIGDSESDGIASKNACIKFGYASWDNKNIDCEYDYIFESVKDILNI